jgi:hypothetical protein
MTIAMPISKFCKNWWICEPGFREKSQRLDGSSRLCTRDLKDRFGALLTFVQYTLFVTGVMVFMMRP